MTATVDQLDILRELNIPPNALSNKAEYIRTVRQGLPGVAVKSAIKILGNRELFVRLFDTTSSNLNRVYRKKNLCREDSEELLDTLRVFIEAQQVWGDDDSVREWLDSSVPALNGATPLELFDTFEGRNWVRQVLRKIEHGEFT